ncbi:AMP-binding protein [Caballeronia sp. GAWG2-1]|uniref:AMP-binding protein n=1 Tax=Caballeronia sp. GAWG2-1 TaxID=2921744 RepID=UPI0020284381|nr:AMP-binding protein [Caballeronia sp. GAWG2-1]
MKIETEVADNFASHYKAVGLWEGRTLLDDFNQAVELRPDALAVVSPNGRRMTYRELDAESRAVAAYFASVGVGKGDVISVQLPNWAEFVAVHLAATRLGAVTNPLLPIYRENELGYILGFAHSRIAVIPGNYRNCDYPAMYGEMLPSLPDLKEIVVVGGEAPSGMRNYGDIAEAGYEAVPEAKVSGDDLTALVFTSGTESKPKGVMHTHNTMMYATRTMPKLLGLTHEDVVWAPSPIGHGTGFTWGMRQALTLGCKLVLQDIWDPEEALRLIEAERCTFTLSATPFVKMLLDSPNAVERDTSSFRYFGCAGAPIPRHLGLDAREKLGCLLVGMWGMSECFVGSTSWPGDPEDKIWGTDGKAMPGGELAIFDESHTRIMSPGEVGELATRGPHVALGYFNDPQRTAQAFSPDGWLFTNDLATLDTEGYMRIVGRKKDVINRGGLKISASEIEEFLIRHPLVREVAVVAVPDPRLGEKSCVFVVPRTDHEPKLTELLDYLEEKGVAKYKLPEFMVLLPNFPMTPTGKVQKFALRDGVTGGQFEVRTV